jgi:hypothetical protein
MQALKATEAHEIDKASITEAETIGFVGRILNTVVIACPLWEGPSFSPT